MAKTLIYQLYPISWENRGGLSAMAEHLNIINDLGADYVWLSPLYPSPRCDHGYDVADYQAIDERFGTMSDFDAFVKKAHSYGIGVLMDLVLNHTSTEHKWFSDHPEYYCWTEDPCLHYYQNLFDNSERTWAYDEAQHQYYLHLFHEKQADLNWFPWRDHINKDLVYEFRQIVKFWTKIHEVDGFRLDVPQAINKKLIWPELRLDDLLFGCRAAEVINAVFQGINNLFLIMECFDPTYGGLTEYYDENTPVNFILNPLIKEAYDVNREEFISILTSACQNPAYMLDLESHDSMRFPSRGIMSPDAAIWTMFTSEAEGICLYQGQELGLRNPTSFELSDKRMLELDAQTAMRVKRGESVAALRPTSRANARIPLPYEQYGRQDKNPSSYYHLTKKWIEYWKSR